MYMFLFISIIESNEERLKRLNSKIIKKKKKGVVVVVVKSRIVLESYINFFFLFCDFFL